MTPEAQGRATDQPPNQRARDQLQQHRDLYTGDGDDLNRLVPQNVEAEVCVLGSMILDGAAIDVVVQILRHEHFHRPAHGIIYEALLEMHNSSKPIDLVTLREELTRTKRLDAIGGVEYLVALVEGVPSSANIEYYAMTVRDKALLRQLIRASRTIMGEAFDSTEEAAEVIERAEQQVFEIAKDSVGDVAVGLKDLLHQTFENLQEQEGKAITGLSTGYTQLDEYTAGLQNGEMIIVAARPSMGKTALLLNIAEHMGVIDERPVAFFSLEMSRMQITQRLLASFAQFDLRSMRRTSINPEDWTRLQNAADQLQDAKFLIDDSSTLTSLQLRSKARRLKSQHDIQAVFIDYLQLMTYHGRADSRHEQVGDMSRDLKALARELDIPVVCAAQLNRGPADRPTHTPRMNDLRESGSIEQDADVVALLHNEDYYHRGEEGYVPTGVTKLIIEKQRNGPTGIVNLVFRPECTRFEQAAPGYVGE
ncbi:MAG: replicative DNA helicase [Phycisphaerae bacterium]|jgi:replicative DNA helicase|nr:replicative DNA helicase [Phycisphaerae bacterium]